LISDPGIVLADEPTGALDSRSAKVLMDKLASINRIQKKTILMVTHDANAASYCSRILFIRDGKLFHELRRNIDQENSDVFYERIVTVLARMGGGSANVL
jgi:putative ABC transport system ATP-binding protein